MTVKEYSSLVASEIWGGDKGMEKMYNDSVQEVVTLSDGSLISIRKPTIEKMFCFGYGYCGTASQEEYLNAEKAADIARKNTDYFKTKNMKDIDKTINNLRENINSVVIYPQYLTSSNETKIKEWGFSQWCKSKEAKPIQKEDALLILAAYERTRESFSKRLERYLKRYGLKKIKVWTYMED